MNGHPLRRPVLRLAADRRCPVLLRFVDDIPVGDMMRLLPLFSKPMNRWYILFLVPIDHAAPLVLPPSNHRMRPVLLTFNNIWSTEMWRLRHMHVSDNSSAPFFMHARGSPSELIMEVSQRLPYTSSWNSPANSSDVLYLKNVFQRYYWVLTANRKNCLAYHFEEGPSIQLPIQLRKDPSLSCHVARGNHLTWRLKSLMLSKEPSTP